jgi:sugar phosphate isomerase/epimerase
MTATPGPPDPSRLALNTATVRKQWELPQMIEGCVRHGIPGITPWRDQVARMGLHRAAAMIRDAGLAVAGLCRGGFFPASDGEGRRRAIADNLAAIDEAATLGARCLVLVVGGLPPGSRDLAGAREQVAEGIATVLPHARAAGVPLAIEPLHPMQCADRACVNTLAQALALCDRLGPGVGVAVDVYHVWWDPDLASSIERAGRANRLLGFHLCDWLVPTRDLLNDRGMMGDGVIDLPGIRGQMDRAGYPGFAEVEIFSDHWWAQDPDQVLATMRSRYLGVC